MVLANDINDRLDTPLSAFWPRYENTGEPVRRGDRAIGSTFDREGRDYSHEGMVVDVVFTFTDVFQQCIVTIEDDEHNDWECDAEVIELVRDRDAKGGAE